MTDNHTRPGEPDRTLAERLAPMSIDEIDAMSDQEVAELMGATPEEFATSRPGPGARRPRLPPMSTPTGSSLT